MLKRNVVISLLLGLVLCVPPSFAGLISLPTTGQTSCYDSYGNVILCTGTRQDGELQFGMDSPIPRFVIGAGIEVSCIRDNLTGLMWARGPFIDSLGADAYLIWMDGLLSSNNLLFCGYTDWRLPNINELRSLLNHGFQDQRIWLNSQGFDIDAPGFFQSNELWSSTTVPHMPRDAWVIRLSEPHISISSKTSTAKVLPVRGGFSGEAAIALPRTGQSSCFDSSGNGVACFGTGQDGEIQAGVNLPSPRFISGLGDEALCVVDNLTGLMWPQSPYGVSKIGEVLNYL